MTIRKIILGLIAVVVTLSVSGIPDGNCADVAKIGTVDFQKIYDNSAAGKAAKSRINKEGQQMRADLEKIQKDIKDLQSLIEKDSSSGVMSKEALDDKKWELGQKVNEAKALNKRFEQKLQKMQMRLINMIRKDVLKIIEVYGKKEGFLMILEELGVVYAPQSVNITDKIIQIYNAAYTKQSKK